MPCRNHSQKCADIAVKDKLVPSFETYAAEIDRKIAQGDKTVCHGGFGDKPPLFLPNTSCLH